MKKEEWKMVRKEMEIILTQNMLLLKKIQDYVRFHFKESSSSRTDSICTEREREMHLKSWLYPSLAIRYDGLTLLFGLQNCI